jgi:[ribosomal protein S5]-alanine N-acetyltransferase
VSDDHLPGRRLSGSITTERLELRPITAGLAESILTGADAATAGDGAPRPTDWAPGYPTDGDLVVCRIRVADPPTDDDALRFGLYQVVLRADLGHDWAGCTIGGVGFFGPPVDGAVELGYGLAPVARGQGLATEAAVALVALARSDERVTAVHARTSPDNPASQAVLARLGMQLVGRDDCDPAEPLLCYRLDLTAST